MYRSNFLQKFHQLNVKTPKTPKTPFSTLPNLSFDPQKWPSTQTHTQKTTNLLTLEQTLHSSGVKYLMPAFIDMHGIPKCKMVPLDHLQSCSRGSELFTGAAVDGVPQSISDNEVCAVADPATMMAILPHRKDVCYIPASLYLKDRPFRSCSREIYHRVAKKAKDLGYLMKLGIEAEFFVLRDSEDVNVMQKQMPYCALENLHKPCYDAARLLDNLPWLSELVDAMNGLGWGVYSFDHEDAIGQFEVDFSFCEAGEMADRFNLLRMMTCGIARNHGCFASWMPKPMQDRTGSGAHLNVSLHDYESEVNLFKQSNTNASKEEEEEEVQLSELGTYFLGGVMKHIDAIVAVSCPTVNSYKRMIWSPPPSATAASSLSAAAQTGFSWSPVYASYGANNRTNAVRVPSEGRFEIRASDPSLNPHYAAAMVLAAGLEGIEQQLDPGPSRGHENLFAKSSTTTTATTKMLPRNLGEAVDAFEASALAKDVFGDVMHAAWVQFKREEWMEYNKHISGWELNRYLRQYG